jgi:hypothetical protein
MKTLSTWAQLNASLLTGEAWTHQNSDYQNDSWRRDRVAFANDSRMDLIWVLYQITCKLGGCCHDKRSTGYSRID